ncbi:unnamed protein product [Vicia faba]|uniref:Uncharacterized protein n=1 Tax=Vicia faba TaxID=3906 RepID=A0AAV0ZC82_VICFA|nr:unnamed protein product [Vicia faba]
MTRTSASKKRQGRPSNKVSPPLATPNQATLIAGEVDVGETSGVLKATVVANNNWEVENPKLGVCQNPKEGEREIKVASLAELQGNNGATKLWVDQKADKDKGENSQVNKAEEEGIPGKHEGFALPSEVTPNRMDRLVQPMVPMQKMGFGH